MKSVFVQIKHDMKGKKLFSAAETADGGISVGNFEPKPAKPDKQEIQPLSKVSVSEDFKDFCVLTKSRSPSPSD